MCSSAPSLFHIQRSNAQPDPCCEDSNLRTCQRVNVDEKTLASENDISILGKEYQFSNFIEPSSYAYKTANGDEAVITLNQETGNMFASVKTNDGKSYGIERCHTGHVWKEFDMDSFGADEVVTLPPTSKQNVRRTTAADNTTIVTYTVMFYYTPQVAIYTDDIPGFIDQVIAETNQGYINSMMPVRIAKFCIEEASFDDIEDSSDALKAFKKMKKASGMSNSQGVRALRNTADAAALIQYDLSGCGIAYLDTWDSGNTISVTKKSCATGYFSFGHELGHNFGATHDPDTSDNYYYSYGHGHLIEQGSASTGYRTILAYNAAGHYTRVNYYSNPSVTYPTTGTSTGVAGLSNNAAVITENRQAFADLGDESAACGDTQYTTASPTTTSAPTGPASTSSSSQCNFVKLFSHNTAGGLFAAQQEALDKNSGNPDADLYSILSSLPSFQNGDGTFHFKLCYPETTGYNGGHCNEWLQTSNPATESTITGFQAISLSFTSNGFGNPWVGLGRAPSQQGYSLMTDTPLDGSTWWTAVGATRYHGQGTIPGPPYRVIRQVELYVALGCSSTNSSSPSSGTCGNCVFPFLYAGTQYNTCTSKHWDSPWCATEVNTNGEMTSWEECQEPSCPTMSNTFSTSTVSSTYPHTTYPPRPSPSISCGNCVFPFLYAGTQYNTCTSLHWTSPWCATEVDTNGQMTSWEECEDPSCPTLPSNFSPSTGSTSSPSSGTCGSCVFPFKYGNRQHDTCTTIDGDSPWCATQVDSDGNMVSYEYCQDASCPGTSATTTSQMTVSHGNEVGSCCKY